LTGKDAKSQEGNCGHRPVFNNNAPGVESFLESQTTYADLFGDRRMIRGHLQVEPCRIVVTILLTLVSTATVFAKNDDDVVIRKNGDRLTGELKGLQRRELKIKADYMAESVRLDWSKVQTTREQVDLHDLAG
jgi:hypothetical protein